MIVFVSVEACEINITVLPDNRSQGVVLKYGLRYMPDQSVAMPSIQYIQILNQLFEERTTVVWKSKEEMVLFMKIVGRQLRFRFYQNSVILPPQVLSQIKCYPEIAPSCLQEILRMEGLDSEEKLRRIKLRW